MSNNLKTNLTEVLRAVDSATFAVAVDPRPVPGSSKSNKFKPSTASGSARKPLPSFSTAGWKDKQPQPMIYLSDSASASSISCGLKRNSSDPSVLSEPSPQAPKRPKRDAFSNKENIVRDGKRDAQQMGKIVPLTSTSTLMDINDSLSTIQRERRTPFDDVRYPSPALHPSKPTTSSHRSSTRPFLNDINVSTSSDDLKGWLTHCQALNYSIMEEIIAYHSGKDRTKDIFTLQEINTVLEARIAEIQKLLALQSKATVVLPMDKQEDDVTTQLYAVGTGPVPEERGLGESDDEYWGNFDEPDVTMADVSQSRFEPPTIPASQSSSTLASHSPTPADHQLTTSPHYQTVMETLNRVFGLQSFRKNQLEAVIANMEGKDIFVLMPTGGGKSLCYQLPAVCASQSLHQLTIVVSPLISLIDDQVAQLRSKGVGALAWNSETKVDVLSSGKVPLIFVTPEKLQDNGHARSIIQTLYRKGLIARFVVDEAHCISTWGQDFREAYANMGELRELYPNVPIMALTATANQTTIKDIIGQLKLKSAVQLTQSFNRPNLQYTVIEKKRGYRNDIIQMMKTKYRNQCGIVYCRAKNTCEELCQKLQAEGILAHFYHAGMSTEDRKQSQLSWMEGRVNVVVATIAFGMGIDKANVRFVVHYDMPKCMSGYYQETGRAGRDGKPSECIMYFAFKDFTQSRSMIEDDEKTTPEAKERQVAALNEVYGFCRDCSKCRRVQILHHFDERFDPENCNPRCDVCSDPRVIEDVDATGIVRAVLRILTAAKRQGIAMAQGQVSNGVRGSGIQDIKKKGIDRLEGYSEAKNCDSDLIELVVKQLLYDEVLQTRSTQNGKSNYFTTYVELAPSAAAFQKSLERTRFIVSWRSKSGKTNASARKAAPRTNSVVSKNKGKGKAAEIYDDPIEDDLYSMTDDENASLVPQRKRPNPTSISALAISRSLSRNEVKRPPQSLPTPRVVPVTREDLLNVDAHPEDLYGKLDDLRQQLMKEKYLPNPDDVLDDSVLQMLSLLCPTDYQSFKQTVADVVKDQLGSEKEAGMFAEGKWKLYGQKFLSLCVVHKTGPVGNSKNATIDLQSAYQYRPAPKSSSSGTNTLVTTPMTMFMPEPPIPAGPKSAGGKKFKPK